MLLNAQGYRCQQMSDDAYAVILNGLDGLSDVDQLSPKVALAARQAVNKTIDRARASAARDIRLQVAFPAAYLGPNGGRLTVTKRAQGDDLEAIITGRNRPTSLARFARGTPRGGGVRVEVQPGLAAYLPRAFLIKLRSGTAEIDTQNNLGLAIRLKPGQRPSAAYKPRQVGNGLWLLYAATVGQVFRTVSEDISPEALDFLETEFDRLMERAA